MKCGVLCERMDSHIRYRLRMCIWKFWKKPKNRAKNLIKLDVLQWAAFKIAYCGDRYASGIYNLMLYGDIIIQVRNGAYHMLLKKKWYTSQTNIEWTLISNFPIRLCIAANNNLFYWQRASLRETFLKKGFPQEARGQQGKLSFIAIHIEIGS